MATTKEKKVPFQPVFPEQYPQKCQSCKTPTACEKLMVAGLKADTGCCIFICHWRHKKSRPKNDANMVTDSAPGASDFVTKKNRKILLLRAFLIPGPAETERPPKIKPRRKAQHSVASVTRPSTFLNPLKNPLAGPVELLAGGKTVLACQK